MVDPFEVVGTTTVLFSVFTNTRVCATPLKSKIRISESAPSTALVVVIVIVSVAAELLVTLCSLCVIGTVAAFAVAVIAFTVQITCFSVCVAV